MHGFNFIEWGFPAAKPNRIPISFSASFSHLRQCFFLFSVSYYIAELELT